MNEGAAPPVVVAQVLHFCEAPKPPSGTTVQALLDFSDIPKPQAKASAPFSADFEFACSEAVKKMHPTSAPTRKVTFEDEE
mmetsp:Transcript_83773/g.153645  ORF Transcript_83773/g.153645 Transcript_83773/m.153645 type:complete len:81 (-) Transcript_83773:87-329(-)